MYVGGLYEKRQEPDGTLLHVFSIVGAEGPVAQVQWSDVPVPGGEAVVYLHPDHLGSVESVTNHRGGIEERRKYDPFGQRKDPANPALPSTGSTSRVRQGFTGHEHEDELGLLNMRGRMYDPRLGRFLTPDPLVQAPFSGQALNRYSYVLNNPLAYVDPSGFQAVTVGDGWRPPETPGSVAGWEEYALLRAPSSASLDTLPSESPVRVGGPAGSADQNDSRGMNPLYLGTGTVYMCQDIPWYLVDGADGWSITADQMTVGELMAMSPSERRLFFQENAPGLPMPVNFGSDELDTTWEQEHSLHYQGMAGVMQVLSLAIGASTTAALTPSRASQLPPPLAQVATQRVMLSGGSGHKAPMTVVRLIQRGEKIFEIVNEAKALTYLTGNEHALVKLATGERALVSGGPGGVKFLRSQISRIYGHTHPSPAPPSADDFEALRQLGQTQQTVYHGGQVTKVRVRP